MPMPSRRTAMSWLSWGEAAQAVVAARPSVRRTLGILGVLAVVALLGWFVWGNLAHLGDAPFYTSTDGHFGRSVTFDHFLATRDSRFLMRYGEPISWEKGLSWERYPLFVAYPPLVYLVTAVFYRVGGISLATAQASMSLWGVLLLLGLFFVGRRLGGFAGGLATLVLGVTSPLITTFSRWYVLDLPEAVFCAWALFFLLQSDGLRKPPWILLWALACAGAGLTKWLVVLFLALPALWFILPRIVASRRAFAAACAFLVPLGVFGVGAVLSTRACTTPREWMASGRWLAWFGVSVGLPVLLAFALIAALWRRVRDARGHLPDDVRPILWIAGSGALAALLALPWYWWALGDLIANAGYNVGELETRSLGETLRTLDRAIAESMLWPWTLMGAGVAGIALARRADRGALALLAVSTAGLLAFFVQTGKPSQLVLGQLDSRLLLPVLVYALPLGGWWVRKLGVIGPVACAILLGAGIRHGASVEAGIERPPRPVRTDTLLEDLKTLGNGTVRDVLVMAGGPLPELTRNELFFVDVLEQAGMLLTVGYCSGADQAGATAIHLPSRRKVEVADVVVVLHAPTVTEDAVFGEFERTCRRPVAAHGALRPFDRMEATYVVFSDEKVPF